MKQKSIRVVFPVYLNKKGESVSAPAKKLSDLPTFTWGTETDVS
jgi:hypothetical protein